MRNVGNSESECANVPLQSNDNTLIEVCLRRLSVT